MTHRRTVVALVPTFNGARFLGDTLASLAAQDHPGLRVVISDDASTDDTARVCDQFRGDSRFRLIRQPRRLGWVDNSNALLAEVEGDYAFFAPHDDLFAPSYVRRLVEALEAQPHAVLAFSDTTCLSDRHRFRPLVTEARVGSRVRRAIRFIPEGGYERALPFRGVWRTSALAIVGPLRKSVIGEFDADGRWLFRLALAGPFVRVGEPLCQKRLHPGSLASSWRYRRRTWVLDSLSYINEAHRARVAPLELAAFAAAATLQAVAHLLPSRYRQRFGWRRRAWGL